MILVLYPTSSDVLLEYRIRASWVVNAVSILLLGLILCMGQSDPRGRTTRRSCPWARWGPNPRGRMRRGPRPGVGRDESPRPSGETGPESSRSDEAGLVTPGSGEAGPEFSRSDEERPVTPGSGKAGPAPPAVGRDGIRALEVGRDGSRALWCQQGTSCYSQPWVGSRLAVVILRLFNTLIFISDNSRRAFGGVGHSFRGFSRWFIVRSATACSVSLRCRAPEALRVAGVRSRVVSSCDRYPSRVHSLEQRG